MAVVQDWVAHRGLVSSAITNLGICRTTHDEAVAFLKLKESQGWTEVILVTSALHMRRSEALFRKEHIEVLPIAADFDVWGVPHEAPFSPFPRLHRLYLLSLYTHEKIGWWAYRLKESPQARIRALSPGTHGFFASLCMAMVWAVFRFGGSWGAWV